MSDKSYIKGFLTIIALIVVCGFVVPAMISDPSDVGVIGGILILLSLLFFAGLKLKHTIEGKHQ